jgi:hypothetical protein
MQTWMESRDVKKGENDSRQRVQVRVQERVQERRQRDRDRDIEAHIFSEHSPDLIGLSYSITNSK